MTARTVRTTITLPSDLLSAVDRAVEGGEARSRNELIATALRHELAVRERAAIDAAFAELESDADYHAEARAIADEFATAGWEAVRQTDAES